MNSLDSSLDGHFHTQSHHATSMIGQDLFHIDSADPMLTQGVSPSSVFNNSSSVSPPYSFSNDFLFDSNSLYFPGLIHDEDLSLMTDRILNDSQFKSSTLASNPKSDTTVSTTSLTDISPMDGVIPVLSPAAENNTTTFDPQQSLETDLSRGQTAQSSKNGAVSSRKKRGRPVGKKDASRVSKKTAGSSRVSVVTASQKVQCVGSLSRCDSAESLKSASMSLSPSNGNICVFIFFILPLIMVFHIASINLIGESGNAKVPIARLPKPPKTITESSSRVSSKENSVAAEDPSSPGSSDSTATAHHDPVSNPGLGLGSGSGSGPKTGGRKVTHNAIEKRYRNNINDRITELRLVVPALNSPRLKDSKGRGRISQKDDEDDSDGDDQNDIIDGIPAATKMNKATILRKATEYILHLKSGHCALQKEVLDLLDVIKSLPGGEAKLQGRTSHLTGKLSMGSQQKGLYESQEQVRVQILEQQALKRQQLIDRQIAAKLRQQERQQQQQQLQQLQQQQLSSNHPLGIHGSSSTNTGMSPPPSSPENSVSPPQGHSSLSVLKSGFSSHPAQQQQHHGSSFQTGYRMLAIMFMSASALFASSPFESAVGSHEHSPGKMIVKVAMFGAASGADGFSAHDSFGIAAGIDAGLSMVW
jgi:hypothetical protein